MTETLREEFPFLNHSWFFTGKGLNDMSIGISKEKSEMA
jgi:hypothetical protein